MMHINILRVFFLCPLNFDITEGGGGKVGDLSLEFSRALGISLMQW